MLNFGENANHLGFARDAFDFFDSSEEKYDSRILDPPAVAKHQNV
jgi:23S rRNA (cytosine1962-C5)-methyltransferase